MPHDPISVITVTHRRPALLRRAIASVDAQVYGSEIEHLVVIDDDPTTLSVVDSVSSRPGVRLVSQLIRRPPAEVDDPADDRRRVYPRLSRLFNTGVRLATFPWIAFLDDDNEYEPDHLSSLMELALARGAQAVHSGRTMYWADGEPYLDKIWHTAATPEEGSRIYELMCQRGVRIPGTNILLDRVDDVRGASLRPSSVLQPDDPVLLVDQSVWLIRRELLTELPIPEEFTEEDHRNNAAPDDKLLEVLLDNDVAIYTTRLPTVRYYLGGVSNKRRREATAPPAGRPP